jgi:hypothetical protein
LAEPSPTFFSFLFYFLFFFNFYIGFLFLFLHFTPWIHFMFTLYPPRAFSKVLVKNIMCHACVLVFVQINEFDRWVVLFANIAYIVGVFHQCLNIGRQNTNALILQRSKVYFFSKKNMWKTILSIWYKGLDILPFILNRSESFCLETRLKKINSLSPNYSSIGSRPCFIKRRLLIEYPSSN